MSTTSTRKRCVLPPTVKMKIAVWAQQNLEKLRGKPRPEVQKLLKQEFGVDVTPCTIDDLFRAVGLEIVRVKKPKKGGGRKQLRFLAVIVRDAFKQLNLFIPPMLNVICDGGEDEPGTAAGDAT